MNTLSQDLRFAIRQLRKSPGFTLIAALTLAIGIGAATSVFSLVDAILLRPLPFPQPDRLVAVVSDRTDEGAIPSDSSYPDFDDYRSQAKSFDSMAAYQTTAMTLGAPGAPARRLSGLTVSSDFFRVLGVNPILGRSFNRSEELAGNRSILISQRLWETTYNRSRSILGKDIRVNEQSYYVVGVIPSGHALPGDEEVDLWVTPSTTLEGKNPSGLQRGWHQIEIIARLAPQVSFATANSEIQRIQRTLSAQYPGEDKNTTAALAPELTSIVGDVQRPLRILFGAVCMLLLIACANVAGLLLTRSVSRRGELAIRSALGATRTQITTQLMIESLVLCLLGSIPGIGLAALALQLAPRFIPASLPRAASLTLDTRVLAFALLASLFTAVLFGMLPAWRMSRLDPADALRDQSRGNTANRSQQRLQSILIVSETAIGLVLLIGAGLLIRSFNNALNVDTGFDPAHSLTFRVGIPDKHFTDTQTVQFAEQLQSRLAALPGVQRASYAFPLPLSGGGMTIGFSLPEKPTSQGDQPGARASIVADNFFATMKMPLRHGRLFSAADNQEHAPPVIIINQAFADKYLPNEDPIGKRMVSDLASTEASNSGEIIGVVANVTGTSVTEAPVPAYYLPYAQAVVAPPSFVLRVAGDPAAYTDTVRTLVGSIDPSLPVYAIRSYAELLARNTAQQRFQTILLTAFAAIALLLAAVGLYGVLSFMVTQRTPELGLRMALGAQRGDVLRLILGRGIALAVAGLILGIGASLVLTRYLQTLLFATRALDPTTFIAVSALLLAVSILSCLAPAFRASRLDPNETLRQQ